MTNERINKLEEKIQEVQELQERLNKQDTQKALDLLHGRLCTLEGMAIRDFKMWM
jgi:hypothetical protein